MTRTDTFKDKLMPWYIVLFFVVFTIVLAGFAVIAHRTHTGVVTENAYKKGLAYNDVIKEADEENDDDPVECECRFTHESSLPQNGSHHPVRASKAPMSI